MPPPIRVVTSAQAAARDGAAIAAGIPSRALMQRAGAAVAAEIALRYRERLAEGVLVAAGPGNNGGDAWVVAAALAAAGARVRVAEPVAAKTADARAERETALAMLATQNYSPTESISAALADRGEALVVDGLLGTGSTGAPRGDIAAALAVIRDMRARGATVVAIDVPSGLNASTGMAAGAIVDADLTITFGTMRRGILANRAVCGDVALVDIGLGVHAELEDDSPVLVDEAWVAAVVPAIAAASHKGDRKKLAIVGGAPGMAGASILAARAALRSGIGMVKLVVSPESLPAVQQQEAVALATTWPRSDDDADHEISQWADALVIGPGLGRSDESRECLSRILSAFRGPVVLDADAITLFQGRREELASLLRGRPALLTPHPAEFGRLAGLDVPTVLEQRFDVGASLAVSLGAAVLLKGTPTVVSGPDGRCFVSATGTPALATGGSGDVLSGVAGTLLAQIGDAVTAGAAAAWVHGRAAERVPGGAGGSVRGISLDDVVAELRDAWSFDARPRRYPVLVELPRVGESR